MLRSLLFIFTFLLPVYLLSQNVMTDTAKKAMAPVNVIVTDLKGTLSKGEEILFKSEATNKIFSVRTDVRGKASLQLPSADKYIITVKCLNDTTKYGVMDIPALGPDEFFEEPFKVNVKFQMARSYTLDNVHFDFGKATLRIESFKELDELVSFLKYKDNIKVEIAGHTDNIGNDADNLKLSQQRADAIRNYVIKKGINGARVVSKGYGASIPVADNTTDEGRQINRRTEVRILNQ